MKMDEKNIKIQSNRPLVNQSDWTTNKPKRAVVRLNFTQDTQQYKIFRFLFPFILNYRSILQLLTVSIGSSLLGGAIFDFLHFTNPQHQPPLPIPVSMKHRLRTVDHRLDINH